MGDLSGFMDKIHEVVPMDQQPELLQKLSEGNFTLRIMYEQFQNILKMGPIGQVGRQCFCLAIVFHPGKSRFLFACYQFTCCLCVGFLNASWI